jgi:hemoglobin
MNRKILIAAAVALGSIYSFACGGDDATKGGPTAPTNTATATAPTETATATTTATATETASATTTAEAPKPKSLFERLGGKAAIEKVTDDLLAIIKDDKRIKAQFAKVFADKKKAEVVRNNIVDFLCKATGGDCEYKGKDMKETHKTMKIKDADFDAFMEDAGKALDKNNVAAAEKDEVVKALEATRADVVNVAAKPAAGGAKPTASAAATGAGTGTAAKPATTGAGAGTGTAAKPATTGGAK